ncbi:MAG: hypothetical protein H7145_08375 [Akkermansiaceae bacterium]|nr:hypothetical protein [Armatimonadota bacterium]
MPIFLSEENGTGPFRRWLSKTGFSYEAADIFLPDQNQITMLDPEGQLKPSGDTLYVYMGGRGVNGGEVDAGFQYSAANDNWSLFLAVSGFGFTYGPEPGADPHPRFGADQPVRLEFEVVKQDVLEVRATGVKFGAEETISLAIRADVSRFPTSNANVDADRAGRPTNFNWKRGGSNRLKRVTSIGQTAGRQDFNTGSFVHGVHWSSCIIGKAPGDANPWSGANASAFISHPNNGVVSVDFTSQAEETVSIDL